MKLLLPPSIQPLSDTYCEMIQNRVALLAVPAPKDPEDDECEHSDFTENGICGDCGAEVDR